MQNLLLEKYSKLLLLEKKHEKLKIWLEEKTRWVLLTFRVSLQTAKKKIASYVSYLLLRAIQLEVQQNKLEIEKHKQYFLLKAKY